MKPKACWGHSFEEVVGRYCYEVLRGIFPDGQPLCAAGRPASIGLGCEIPFAAKTCLYPLNNGQWLLVALSSMAGPNSVDNSEAPALSSYDRLANPPNQQKPSTST